MTLQDISRYEESLSKWSDALANALSATTLGFDNLHKGYLDDFSRSISSIYEDYSYPSAIIDSLSQMGKNLASIPSWPDESVISSVIKNFEQASKFELGAIASIPSWTDESAISSVIKNFEQASKFEFDAISRFDSLFSQTLFDSLSDTLTQIEPYLPPEKKEQCENVILPKLKHKSPKLTLSDALSILSILVAIFFGIIASMPDEQTEQIIAQNEIIIDQQEEIIRLQKEDDALLNTLDSLTNSINLLSYEIELLREESESSDDSSVAQSQENPTDSQNQDSDTQD